MIDANNHEFGLIEGLVASLPEKYQPIYRHPQLSAGSSRGCEDRLDIILAAACRLSERLGRPLRVLDLGCAQGYFSLNLAARGFIVHGVDFLDKNVAVCQALAAENGFNNASFQCAKIEDVISELQSGQYDLVLGLSVFHHLVHMHGYEAVIKIIADIAGKAAVGIYEVARREEPLYWGPSQPEDPAVLLQCYAFRRILAYQPTHLSGITRPLYFTSNRYWYLGDDVSEILGWRTESHANAMGSHFGTRRYFFGKDVILKQMSLVNAERRAFNLEEYTNEVTFLQNIPPGVSAPKLIHHQNDGDDLWILREMLPGRLLSEIISEHVPYAYEPILDGIVVQLVALENAGLYHNDVRCWNILIAEDGVVSLIDYGAISATAKDCVWPDDLLLSLLITVREVIQGYVMPPHPVRRPMLDVSMLPASYRGAFLKLFALPKQQWTYGMLQRFSVEAGTALTEVPPWASIVSSYEKALLEYERAIVKLKDESKDIYQQLQESLGNAHHWFLMATEKENEIFDLNRRYESESSRLEQLFRSELDASLANTHHLFLRANDLEQQLHRIHSSRSWRITRPLRFFGRLVSAPKATMRRLFVALMRRIMQRPALARFVNRLVRFAPALHYRLRNIARQNNLVEETQTAHPAPALGQVDRFAGEDRVQAEKQLSIRGRDWYARLRTRQDKEVV